MRCPPGHRRLLNHFDRDAAGQDDCAAGTVNAGPRHRAAELVQRIVAANVLADKSQAAAGAIEAGGMDSAGSSEERLVGGK